MKVSADCHRRVTGPRPRSGLLVDELVGIHAAVAHPWVRACRRRSAQVPCALPGAVRCGWAWSRQDSAIRRRRSGVLLIPAGTFAGAV